MKDTETSVDNLKLVCEHCEFIYKSSDHSVLVRIGEIDTLLANAHTSGKLSLRLPLGRHLLPAMKALRYQDSLWFLDLSSSKLNDILFQVFCCIVESR